MAIHCRAVKNSLRGTTFYSWLSMRGNSFLVCSVCDEIGSEYAQHAIKSFPIAHPKIWFRVCSVTAEMFEHRNSGENRRKRSEIFFESLRRAYKDLM
jgi:hypothetical protein